jgi:outer membrane protein insertion porin family
LRREVLINEGDIYNDAYWEYSVVKLNQLGYFNPIDKDKDVDRRTNDEEATVDLSLKVSERGRQQISFNGGISGIGGSFFGLEYSTNNLLGRGEVLSFNLAAGNRQRSFQFSFTEPYIRDRPISAGFSVFAFSQKFFGEGTFLSQNINAQEDLLGQQFNFGDINEANLFTRDSYGGSLFVSAPLSEFYRKRRFTQFSRIGASYQLSLSSVKDPEVNQDAENPTSFIPVIYRQPNIVTSRGTLTFSYDTRNASIDPTSGREISAAIALAGLGGDVRTYQPTISYTHFFPVRRKRSERPEVFGFRIIAGTVGSFATTQKVREANSLAFVSGVPIFERFFLGDEFTIRGYNVRSISPIAPVDTFVTTQDVVIASNAVGEPVEIPGFPASAAALGLFTGATGSNVAQLPRSFTSVGGDTQILGNFEYRIPIISDIVSLAAFADIGSAFNLRTKNDQSFSSSFLPDQPFLATAGFLPCQRFGQNVAVTLSSLALCKNPALAASPFLSLVARDNRIVSQAELEAAGTGDVNPVTLLPRGFQPVFLRGEAQTNSVVKLSQSLFAGIGDYRSSLGMEVRVQVPIINVPFRLIFAYNPNARPNQIIDNFPFFFNEEKKVIRFSVGRTF